MINTNGYDVSVIPQYTPVNPALVAYNPRPVDIAGAWQDGSLGALNVLNEQEKLKAYKAQQDFLASIRPLEAQKNNAQNLRDINLAPSETQAGAAKNAEQVALAQQKAKDAAFYETQRPVLESTQTQANAAEEAAAPTNAQVVVDSAKAKLAQAQLDAAKAHDAFISMPEDKKRHDAYLESQTEVNKAASDLHRAQAAYTAQKPDLAVEIAKIKSDKHSTLMDLQKAASQDEARMSQNLARAGSVKVTDPTTGDQIPVSELTSKLFTEQSDGTLKPTTKGILLWEKAIKADPDAQAALSRYQSLLKSSTESQRRLDSISQQLFDNAGLSKPTEPRPNVIQEGVEYKWDGSSYVPAK